MPIDTPKANSSPSPTLSSLPKGCAHRLIDKGLLHYEASVSGFSERYGRGETSHTIHVWWARRPHTAMRALIFASLCKRTDEAAENLLSRLGLATSLPDNTVHEARSFLGEQYEHPPRVLDMFGGGGTIPLEALNLGAHTYAIDSNELSVFIQKCNLVYSQSGDSSRICSLLKSSGTRVLRNLENDTRRLYPLRQSAQYLGAKKPVFAYLWSYSALCAACGYRYFLIKRPWLSKKSGKNIAFTVENGTVGQAISHQAVAKDYAYPSVWHGRTGLTKCPKCGTLNQKADISKCRDELIALVRPATGKGKEFICVVDDALPDLEIIRRVEAQAIDHLNCRLPDSVLPVWSGIINPALYGVRTHAEFLNPRQRAVLILLIKCLSDEYELLCRKESEPTAKYILSLLSGLIDQIVDWDCRLSMWIPQNEQVGRAFCGPGVSMLWDYVETDPISSGPGNLWDKLDRIIKGASSIKQFPQPAHIGHGFAQRLPYRSNFFDAVVTDPPYYDNVYYSALADFFFAWKRILLRRVAPDLFERQETDHRFELVASAKRNGTAKKAHLAYCSQLKAAICEAARVLKPDGVFSFIYSHSSINGWDALIKAYRPSRLMINSVQPLSIERKQRPRAMTSQAVNTCIAFTARKYDGGKQAVTISNIIDKFTEIYHSGFINDLEAWGWKKQDIGIAVFAHGVGLIANVKAISDGSDAEAMLAIEKIVRSSIPEFKLVKRKSL